MCCAYRLIFYYSSKKLHLVIHVPRRLLGSWAEPVWEWKTLLWLVFVTAPRSMAAGLFEEGKNFKSHVHQSAS
ncbi:hypothetical protein EK904_010434 [Melospiza melodia maxima]|nr:hypothetical protein EK904_010434 [Melospiza melodia maxima]